METNKYVTCPYIMSVYGWVVSEGDDALLLWKLISERQDTYRFSLIMEGKCSRKKKHYLFVCNSTGEAQVDHHFPNENFETTIFPMVSPHNFIDQSTGIVHSYKEEKKVSVGYVDVDFLKDTDEDE
jgi:hypothetical protein